MTKICDFQYPIYDQNGWKTKPFGAPHTYIGHVRKYLPGDQRIQVTAISSVFRCLSASFGASRQPNSN